MPDLSKNITIQIFSKINGELQPNPLFHRSYDKLHSRCIEYPYAASKVGESKKILDIGTAKSSPYWIQWLESLEDREVYGVDYDDGGPEFKRIKYAQADVRRLPFSDNSFDVVLAVSVIEHIGLDDPQVHGREIPFIDENGDVEAVQELSRVLKPGGRIVMTFPFGFKGGLMKNKQARIYDKESIRKFNKITKLISADYFEYQQVGSVKIFKEEAAGRINVFSWLKTMLRSWMTRREEDHDIHEFRVEDFSGSVTWRKVDLEKASAANDNHVDGVFCGVYQKQDVIK